MGSFSVTQRVQELAPSGDGCFVICCKTILCLRLVDLIKDGVQLLAQIVGSGEMNAPHSHLFCRFYIVRVVVYENTLFRCEVVTVKQQLEYCRVWFHQLYIGRHNIVVYHL